MNSISIKSGNMTLKATLSNTATAQKIRDLLPIEGSAQVWGDEIYFMIPLETGLENDAREEVEVGDLAYWPDGPAFCIFFGRTPVSVSDKPKAYSAVNVFGKIDGDISGLKTVNNGDPILIEQA